jgi:hypothetical protein
MPFGGFKNLEEVIRTYQLTARVDLFIEPLAFAVDQRLQDRLQVFLAKAPVGVSEEAICEFLIAPILQEVWLGYLDILVLWSHAQFGDEAPLVGFPDYMFSRRSQVGPFREPPFVFFMEAKRDELDLAWSQCLAAMLAGQKVNPSNALGLFGGVSNGPVWYFGKLEGSTFTQDPRPFTVTHLAELLAALNYLLDQACRQLPPPSPGGPS